MPFLYIDTGCAAPWKATRSSPHSVDDRLPKWQQAVTGPRTAPPWPCSCKGSVQGLASEDPELLLLGPASVVRWLTDKFLVYRRVGGSRAHTTAPTPFAPCDRVCRRRRRVATAVEVVVVPTHDARGCCRGYCGCRLCSTAGVCRSREFWQEAVGTCGLSCQLPRRLDFFAEKSIEVGDEILGRTLFYDVTDLPRQIHGLEGSK